MSDVEKLRIELAARFLEAHIANNGLVNDNAYTHRALTAANLIVNEVLGDKHQAQL